MANLQYSRPASGFRFRNKGLKTNVAPDAMDSDKYPLLVNVRSYTDDQMGVRPGMNLLFATGSNAPVTNIASYSQGTGAIRYLAASGGNIYKDDSATAIDTSFSASQIQSMIPYRPNQSSLSWIYVGDQESYRKFSFPSSLDVVTDQKVGIAEPQVPVDFGIGASLFTPLSTTGNQTIAYTPANAGVITDTPKVTDTVAAVFQDPATAGIIAEYTVETTSSTQEYSLGEYVSIGTPDVDCYQIKDVYPALVGTLTINSIYYYAGTTGRCVVTPYNVGQSENDGLSIQQQNVLTGIRRGALITLNTETCYVLGTAIGPGGTISFEVSTTGTHAAGETITGKPAIKVLLSSNYNGVTPTAPTVSAAISAHYASFTVAANTVGTQTSVVGISEPFSFQNIAYRPDDYVHLSVMCSALANLNECKMLFDCSATPGAFTDYYYFAVRPSDIQAGVNNTLTQLGAAQLASQRYTIDEENKAHGTVSTSSATALPGDGSWSDIFIPISSFQANRVGSDQTRTLMNINTFQILVNTNSGGGVTFGFHTVDLFGGFSPDCGTSGAERKYRIRPRSSVTGGKGNPSPAPRYGIRPRREEVQVVLPTTYSDPQVDTWDIFMLGGTVTDWHWIGAVPLGTAYFYDNYDDLTALAGEILEFDNLEPWPTLDVPFVTTANAQGTVAVVSAPGGSGPSFIGNYLPGNKVQIAQQTFTLWTRPTPLTSSTWLFQFQENTGVLESGVAIRIYEPLVANQNSPFIWGPTDEGGVIFGLDPLRFGNVGFCKNFNPDSAPDSYTVELCPPSEPLLGGFVVNGQSYAFSSARYWPLRPSFTQANRWTPVQPHKKGLASPFGLATNGRVGFFVSDDGIYAIGADKSLTEDDLSNIFPRDGVQAPNQSYLGVFFPPDFTKSNQFRLAICGNFLYFHFIDLGGTWQTLVYDIANAAWCLDQQTPRVQVSVPVVQATFQASGPSTSTNPVRLLFGDATGNVYEQVDGVGDTSNPIDYRIVTAEYLGGDDRALKQWGDIYLNLSPPQTVSVSISARSGSVDIGSPLVVTGTGRQAVIVPVNADYLSLGLDIQGSVAGTFYIWQPSYIPQPVIEQARFSDWKDGGFEGNGFWQGFSMEANTNGQDKALQVRDGETLNVHPFTLYPVNYANQSEQTFSFNAPFVAHSVRMEPLDDVNWNFWRIKWVKIPYPEAAETWITEGMTHGIHGYQHVYQVNVAYISTQPVTLSVTATSSDETGNNVSQTVTAILPPTGIQLAPNKVLVKLPPIKGKVWTYSLTSTVPFYLWRELCETWVKGWGQLIGVFNRPAPFERLTIFGGESKETAEV